MLARAHRIGRCPTKSWYVLRSCRYIKYRHRYIHTHTQNRQLCIQASETGERIVLCLPSQNKADAQEKKEKKTQYDDIILDRTFASPDQSFLSGFTRTSYIRPDEQEGVTAMHSLNKWITNGISITGGEDNLGFLFMYELMTGTIKFKILPGDSGFGLATMLMRLIPQNSTQNGLLMSYLRALENNPDLLTDEDLPKFADTRKYKVIATMFKGMENDFSRLVKALQDFMGERQFRLNWPTKVHAAGVTNNAINTVDLFRDWTVPRHSDLNCDSRQFRAVSLSKNAVGSAVGLEKLLVGISAQEVKAMSNHPMDVISLDKYIEYRSLAQRKKPAVSGELPFNIDHRPETRSPIAASVIERTRKDCAVYAHQQNTGVVPQLKSLFDEDIDAFDLQGHNGTADNAALNQSVAQMEALLQVLIDLRSSDSDHNRWCIVLFINFFFLCVYCFLLTPSTAIERTLQLANSPFSLSSFGAAGMFVL